MKNIYVAAISAVIVYGCKKPYNLTVTNNYANILVVEGIINTGGADSTFIKLSRTGKVNDTTITPEANANVMIENRQGIVLSLTEKQPGIYAAPPVALDNTKQYRLQIKTNNGVVYLSDYIDVKTSPPIDSVGFNLTTKGVQIYTSTHDPANNTRYYRYTYRETWQFTAKYPSNFVSNGTEIVDRLPADQVFYCFGSDTSSHTIINSTAALVKDVAYQVPIISIDSSSEKIETKYSILVKQQALTKDAYAFYKNLQKNTENLGSIFDAQPSELTGNIHNVANVAEPVIGYITAGNTPSKRIFIAKTQLPSRFVTVYPYACKVDSVYDVCDPKVVHFPQLCQVLVPPPPAQPSEQALYPFTAPDSTPGYLSALNICTECTLRGHVAKPTFWK